jgi:hypothetical protein
MALTTRTIGTTPAQIAAANAASFTVSNHGPGSVVVIGGTSTAPTDLSAGIVLGPGFALSEEMSVFRDETAVRVWLVSANGSNVVVAAGQTNA